MTCSWHSEKKCNQILSTEGILKICSDTELSSELDFITETLKKNGFPKKLIKGQMEKLKHQENNNNPLSQQ